MMTGQTIVPLLAKTVATDWYTHPEVFELEKQRIFQPSWQYIGLTSEVPEAGNYLAGFAGHLPVIVTRGEDGDLHAFLNICRHRGNELVDLSRNPGCDIDGKPLPHFVEDGGLKTLAPDTSKYQCKGKTRRFVCQYHAWSYGLDGSLKRAPRSQNLAGFDIGAYSLSSVKVDNWGPLIFVNPSVDAPPLSQVLGDLPHLYREAGVILEGSRFKVKERREYYFRANWKVVVDNFLECYHCPLVHPEIARELDVSDGWYRFESGAYFSWYSLLARDSPDIGSFSHVWPNFFLSVLPDGSSAVINWILPVGPRQSVHMRQFCFTEDVSEDHMRASMELLDRVVEQDRRVCEGVQRGLDTGFIENFELMLDTEQGTAHFQGLVRQALRS